VASYSTDPQYEMKMNVAVEKRPISLTSIIGKLMERIITSRLEGYVETNDILDEEQEDFDIIDQQFQ
jgi:hypothetical protein